MSVVKVLVGGCIVRGWLSMVEIFLVGKVGDEFFKGICGGGVLVGVELSVDQWELFFEFLVFRFGFVCWVLLVQVFVLGEVFYFFIDVC